MALPDMGSYCTHAETPTAFYAYVLIICTSQFHKCFWRSVFGSSHCPRILYSQTLQAVNVCKALQTPFALQRDVASCTRDLPSRCSGHHSHWAKLKARGGGRQGVWWLRKILCVISDLQAGRTDGTGKTEGWNKNLFGKLAGITVSERGTRQANKTSLCENREKQRSPEHAVVTESTFSHACKGIKLATFPIIQKL